ncbi:MAG: lamin tail domain-containing protein [Myxococcales bacterium]|nr:lamin tail domain-containing protein [Myxococcales bacterium]
MTLSQLRSPSPLALTLTLLAFGCSGGGGDSSGGETTSEGGSSSGGDTSSSTSTSTGGSSSSSTGAPETSTSGGDVCGDGVIDAGEDCDSDALGGKTCADVGEGMVGTLACADDCTLDASGCAAAAAIVLLNEVTSKGVLEGPYADHGDAIELYNAGDAPVDLDGWAISDDPTFPVDKTYVFPAKSSLPVGGYLVLVAYDPMSGTGELPFGISASNEETITLRDAAQVQADQLVLNGADAEISWCRLPDGADLWTYCDQTFGGPNVEAASVCGNGIQEGDEACDGDDLGGLTCADLGFAGGALACTIECVPNASMCTSGSTVAINEIESTDDQIELYNAGGVSVDISGWILTDDVVDQNYDPAADLEKLVFPALTSLGPKQFRNVMKGMLPGMHPFGLSAGGETVTLLKPDLSVVSVVTYGDGEAATSFCRLPDGPAGTWTIDCTPTFGAANKP